MKNFLVHLSMSLGYSINPELWYKTDHYQLKRDHRPQDLLTSDIFKMINELKHSGEISDNDANQASQILDNYNEIDLKKVLVRAMENDSNKREVPCVDHDHDYEEDLENAIELFHEFNSKRYQ